MMGGAGAGGANVSTPPPAFRNVLYLVFDDLRSELSPYVGKRMVTPNIQRLADTGLLFERAYCQVAVCSPSRNSFTTGRRPNATGVYNFINHFRQATCDTQNRWRHAGVAMPGGFNVSGVGWNATKTGGYAQCCTTCSSTAGCVAWSYEVNTPRQGERAMCTLFSAVTGGAPCEVDAAETSQACVSGSRGDYQSWTPLPAHFRNHGYLVLGSGKYYHDGAGGLGGAAGDATHPAGQGAPPLADRALSWSDVAVQWPNQTRIVEEWGQIPFAYGNFQYMVPDDEACGEEEKREGGPSVDYCAPAYVDSDGTPPTPPRPGQRPLADFVTSRDALGKLRYAAANRAISGQPFFLVTGIKRPHLNWRVPPAAAALYPRASVTLPTQRTLDRSIWAGAYSAFPMEARVGGAASGNFVRSPYESATDAQLRELRRHYYAAVSWADTAAGTLIWSD